MKVRLATAALALIVAAGFFLSSGGTAIHGEWEALPLEGPDPQLSLVFGPRNRCLVSDRGVDYACVYSLRGNTVQIDNDCGNFTRLELSGDPSSQEMGARLIWQRKDGSPLLPPSSLRLQRR